MCSPLLVGHAWRKVQRCRSEGVAAAWCSESKVGLGVELLKRLQECKGDAALRGSHVEVSRRIIDAKCSDKDFVDPLHLVFETSGADVLQ